MSSWVSTVPEPASKEVVADVGSGLSSELLSKCWIMLTACGIVYLRLTVELDACALAGGQDQSCRDSSTQGISNLSLFDDSMFDCGPYFDVVAR